MAKVATPETEQPTSLLPYQKVNEQTGEVVSKYKYLPGQPRQYRFDGKAGVFNINGDQVLGKSITIQPIAWQIFSDNILGMGVKTWAEIFFIDEKSCVSAVMFHGYSVDNLKRLIEPLFYDDMSLADVVLTATAEKKQNKDGGTYYMAFFSYKPADKAVVAELAAYVRDTPIWRAETLTANRNVSMSHGFALPYAHEQHESLPAGDEQPEALPWEGKVAPTPTEDLPY